MLTKPKHMCFPSIISSHLMINMFKIVPSSASVASFFSPSPVSHRQAKRCRPATEHDGWRRSLCIVSRTLCSELWGHLRQFQLLRYQTAIIETTTSSYSALLCPQEDEVLLKQGGLDEGLSGNLICKQWKYRAPLKPSLPSTMVLMRSFDLTIREILLGQSWCFSREA